MRKNPVTGDRGDIKDRARIRQWAHPGRVPLLLITAIISYVLTSCAPPPIATTALPPTPTAVDLPELNSEQPAPTRAAPPAAPLPRVIATNTAVIPRPTAVSSLTPVFLPTAGSLGTATPEPVTQTPVPTATAVEEAPRGGARVVRDVLPNDVYCPMRDAPVRDEAQLLGYSAVCELPIVSYRLGQGDTALVLVGGMHGGYEWNTVLLAENALRYLSDNPQTIPASLAVYVIPNANPDGLFGVTRRDAAFEPPATFEETIRGRFNGNDVDLNRNWDCNWQREAWWGNDPVSGGDAPFSEPETQALRDYFLDLQPAAIIFWHSAATGVYAAGCGETYPESAEIARVFGTAAEYDVFESFDNYDVTGDAGDWLAGQGIPAITVELTNHVALDWEANLKGLEALLLYLAEAAE